jgi:hypothetical protein
MHDALMSQFATDSWQNWVTVLGYLGFTLFIVWRVLLTSKK